MRRRRRFLRAAAGGLGAVALGGGNLGRALAQDPDRQDPADPCTTTTTYSSSTSSSTSYPSASSYSRSYTLLTFDDCDGTESESHINSWSFSGVGGGVHTGVSTYQSTRTQSSNQEGGKTYSTSCKDGTATLTHSYDSYPAWTYSYSRDESGTKTVTCEDGNMFRHPGPRSAERSAATLPPTLDVDDGSLLEARSRVRLERRLRLLDR